MSIPLAFKRKSETKNEFTKRYTNLLYDQLPQTSIEDREQYTEIRDKIIEINKGFFGFVVSRKFLNNSYATYEDKVQACIKRFCECWTWYKFKPKCSRDDISFAVFYTPRLGEMLERDFNEVQYSLRRTLCKEVGDQIGKHWGKVTYDDLSDPRVNIPSDHMASLMAMFGSLYPGSSDEISPYLEAPDEISKTHSPVEELDDSYDDYVNLLIREMVHKEKKLTAKDINLMGEIYQIDPQELKKLVPVAESQLYSICKSRVNY